MGCAIESTPAGLTVQGGPLQGVTVDMATMPDLVPTLAVLAAFAQGDTVITGVAHLRHKESDRLAMRWRRNWRKWASRPGKPQTAWSSGAGRLQGAVIHTYNDHRIAMSFAVAGLKAPGMNITDPDCVAKSFPDFWEFFDRLYA